MSPYRALLTRRFWLELVVTLFAVGVLAVAIEAFGPEVRAAALALIGG